MENTFLTQLGTALGILFVVAVATEILIETLRGILAGVFDGYFARPFFKSQTDLKTALESVADMFPEDQADTKLLLMRLENAHQKALKIAQSKAEDIKKLVDEASNKESSIAAAKDAIHANVSTLIAEIELTDRQRKTVIKILSAAAGVLICWPTDIDAFRELGLAQNVDHLGAVLTGLGAAGGSNFWHDQVERVRMMRSAASIVAPAGKA